MPCISCPSVTAALVLACTGGAAFAQTRTYIGPAGGNWFTTAHWTPNTVPNASRDALIVNGRSAAVDTPGALVRRIDLGDVVTTGALAVTAAGTGTSASLWINDGSTFTVSGPGVVWNNTLELAIQGPGAAVMVSNGAKLTTTPESFNNNFIDYTGSVTVTGANSRWDSPGSLTTYTGSISVLNGATAAVGSLGMSFFDDNIATLTVSGGSQLTVNGLQAGWRGQANVNLETGGILTVSGGLPISVDTHSRINIGNGGIAGVLNAGELQFRNFNGGGGELSFNHTNNVTFSTLISGNGMVTKRGSGIATLSASNTYTGATAIFAGTLHVTGSATGSAFTVAPGGKLSGTGLTGPVTLEPNGTLAPGNSAGVLTVSSGSVLDGTTEMEIGGLTRGTQYDGLNVSGPGALNLGGLLDVNLINSFTPSAGNTFHLFDAAGLSGTFAQYDLPALPGGLGWDTSSLGTTGNLSVIAVPEPACAGLILCTGVFVLNRRRSVRSR